MKPATAIVKNYIKKKRERVNLYDNQHKKRRFRPQISSVEDLSKTTTTLPDILRNTIQSGTITPVRVFSTTSAPNPMIPESFPVFENISFAQLEAYGQKQPKHMKGFKSKQANDISDYFVPSTFPPKSVEVMTVSKSTQNIETKNIKETKQTKAEF